MMRRCHAWAQQQQQQNRSKLKPFQRCVAVINTSSGSRQSRHTFAATFQRLFDQHGVTTELLTVPGPDAPRLASLFSTGGTLLRETGGRGLSKPPLPSSTDMATASNSTSSSTNFSSNDNKTNDDSCVIVCGGDGTINSLANIVAQSPPNVAEAAQRRLCLFVPTGTTNSICHSLGIDSVQRSISCLSSRSSVAEGEGGGESGGEHSRRRTVRLPIWEVKVNDMPLRFVLSTVAVGTYARIVERQSMLADADQEVVGLPSVKKRFRAAVFYETLWNSTGAGGWASLLGLGKLRGDNVISKLRLVARECPSSPQDAQLEPSNVNKEEQRVAALSTIVATQLNYQRQGYSVTLPTTTTATIPAPNASSAQLRPSLSVTYTDASKASRLRMLHLFWKEGRDRHVLQEDGVTQISDVSEMSFRMPYDSPLMLDGEVVRIPQNSRVATKKKHSVKEELQTEEDDDSDASTCVVTVRPMDPPRFLTVLLP